VGEVTDENSETAKARESLALSSTLMKSRTNNRLEQSGKSRRFGIRPPESRASNALMALFKLAINTGRDTCSNLRRAIYPGARYLYCSLLSRTGDSICLFPASDVGSTCDCGEIKTRPRNRPRNRICRPSREHSLTSAAAVPQNTRERTGASGCAYPPPLSSLISVAEKVFT